MLHLSKIHISNFKSYLGDHSIGPLDNFTCIVGPNGSGKSNILDAITFALNVNISHLRVNRVGELISNGATECTVTLELVSNNKEREVKDINNREGTSNKEGTSNNRSFLFTRSYSSSSYSNSSYSNSSHSYSINSTSVSSSHYSKELEKINIFSKIRNYIIYQGVLHSNNTNLFDVIEKISGSDIYKAEYEKLRANYLACNKILQSKNEKKKDILNDLTEVENAKEKEKEFLNNMKSIEELTKQIYALEICIKEEEMHKITTKHKCIKTEAERAKENPAYREIHAEVNRLKTEVSHEFKEYYEKETEIKALTHKDNKEEQEKSRKEQEIADLREKVSRYNRNNLEEISSHLSQLSDEFMSDLSESLLSYNSATADLQKEESRLKLANYENITKRNHIEQQNKRYTLKRDKLTQENNTATKNNTTKRNHIEKQKRIISALKEKANPDLYDQLSEINKQLTTKQTELTDITKQILLHKATTTLSKHNMYVSTVVENLRSINTGVYGRVTSLITSAPEFSVPIAVLLHKYENTVVVESEGVAIECIRYLKETKSCKLTFIILSNYRDTRDTNGTTRDINGINGANANINANNANTTSNFNTSLISPVSCVSYDPIFSNLVHHIFRGRIITREYKRELLSKYKGIVTTEGVLYQPNGLIIHNSTNSSNTNSNTSTNNTNNTNSSNSTAVLDELVSSRISCLNAIKNITNKKGSFSSINKYMDQIKQIEHEITTIQFDTVVDVEECMKDDRERIESDNKTLADLTGLLREYEYASQFIREKMRQKEKETVGIILERIGIKSYTEYTHKLREIEEYNSTKRELERCETEYSRLYSNSTTTNSFYETLSALTGQLTALSHSLEQSKQRLRTKTAEYKEYSLGIEEKEHKLMNITLTLRKQEESIKELIEYCTLETELTSIEEIRAYNSNKIGGTRDNVSSSNRDTIPNKYTNLNALKKEKDRIHRLLQCNITYSNSNSSALSSKYVKFNREYEFAKESAQEAKRHFNEISNERKRLFDREYERIEKEINRVYRELAYGDINTGIDQNTDQNNLNSNQITDQNNLNQNISDHISDKTPSAFDVVARISRDHNLFSPSSIKLYLMPPGKGYVEFSDLSGGEKSLAVLSFIFAISRTPPFFILDEVDGALDRSNSEKLRKYIQRRREQFIVISLKEHFYCESDSLIGIYKEKENKSGILSYRLK